MASTTDDLTIVTRDMHLISPARYPVKAATTIPARVFVGMDSAVARSLVAGDPFVGISTARADNSAGAAGDIDVDCERNNKIKWVVPSSGSSSPNTLVYASDNQTLSLSSGGNSLMGALDQQVSGTTWWIKVSDSMGIAT